MCVELSTQMIVLENDRKRPKNEWQKLNIQKVVLLLLFKWHWVYTPIGPIYACIFMNGKML